ncbi:MAG: sortase [Alphaproteobacteria bacterium]
MPRLTLAAAIVLMAAGIALTGYGLLTPAKAWLSVRLLDRAWERVLAGEEGVRPWPWMDSEPVARLRFAKAGDDPASARASFVVMRGVSGSILAFAPGWHEGTARPGDDGAVLISAHRDTHFAILKNIARHDRLVLEDRTGKARTYEVRDMVVTGEPVLRLDRGDERQHLLLVTCYPLDAWRPNSPERLVVVAEPI